MLLAFKHLPQRQKRHAVDKSAKRRLKLNCSIPSHFENTSKCLPCKFINRCASPKARPPNEQIPLHGCGSKPCTPGEHQNRWYIGVHPQNGGIGNDPWPHATGGFHVRSRFRGPATNSHPCDAPSASERKVSLGGVRPPLSLGRLRLCLSLYRLRKKSRRAAEWPLGWCKGNLRRQPMGVLYLQSAAENARTPGMALGFRFMFRGSLILNILPISAM